MSLHPTVVQPDTTLSEAVQLLAESGREGLPVVDDGVPIGFVSETKLMQATAILLARQAPTVKPNE
jgi:CBS domain-containing protein